MEIDLSREELITFKQANSLLPRGRRVNLTTWWRWHARGRHGVRLATVVCGGRRYTTKQAVARFFQRLTELDGQSLTSARSGTQPSPAAASAMGYLQREGILAAQGPAKGGCDTGDPTGPAAMSTEEHRNA